jgi:opacity protein-like surface antigen
MRRVSIILAILMVYAATAGAQTRPAGAAPHDYFAVVDAGVTAGHATGGVFNIDIGKRLNETWDVYLEAGRMTDTRTATMDTDAAVIVAVLGPSATVSAKQPATYGALGARYKVPTTWRVQPYVGVGLGVAKVTRDVAFTVNGNSVNAVLLDTFGVQLGTDLSGSETKALFTFGIGGQIPLRGMAFADVSYRFARMFLSDAGLNTNRVQFGIGVRF